MTRDLLEFARGPALTVALVVFVLGTVFFGYAPHIAFIRRLTGLSWPALPDMVMYLAAGATIVSLLLIWFPFGKLMHAFLFAFSRGATGMRGFVSEFGVTAALHMESCHFHVATGDAKYTPIYKLEPFRRAYLRKASPFKPLVRALGLVKKPSITDLQH